MPRGYDDRYPPDRAGQPDDYRRREPEPRRPPAPPPPPAPTFYEYRVIELREGLIGGKMSGNKLERLLNENAREGWQLKAITAVEVKGRVGPGGTEGVLITFERPLLR